jgi:peptide/nickel transport system substrate-binding protein
MKKRKESNQMDGKFCGVFFLLFLTAVMAFAGGGRGGEIDVEEPKLKTLVFLHHNFPRTMDPSDWRGGGTQIIMDHLHDKLVLRNPEGKMIPSLAESITPIDEVTYEIKIRQGVTFHNGDPLTSEDLVFYANRTLFEGGMEDGQTSANVGRAGPLESVEVVDDYTFIAKLTNPFDMTQRWALFYAIPKDYFEEVGPEGFREHPIGCGPFKWVQGDLKTEIVLERNENYWGGPDLPGEVDRVPALDRLIFQFNVEATTRVAALMAGDVDITTEIPIDMIDLLEKNPNTRVLGAMGSNIETLWFNTNKAPFDDKRVRQAIAYAIDYDSIIEHHFKGYAELLQGRPFMIPFEGMLERGKYEHVLPPYHYNLEKAKALLEEAGVSGSAITIDSEPIQAEVAQIIAQMLGDIGFDASVRVWGDRPTIQELFRKGERDLMIGKWGRASRDPAWIKIVASTGDRGNHGNYSNPTLDDLVVPGYYMDPELPERYEMLIEGFELAIEELPVLSLWVPDSISACRNHVKNIVPYYGIYKCTRFDIEN